MTPGLDPAVLLKEARVAAGLSQRELARRAGTAQSVVARIELGEASPTTRTLNRLLAAADRRLDVALRPADGVLRDQVRAFFLSLPVPGLVSVYLFGSTARGARHRESDVDVAVLLDRGAYPSRTERTDLRVRLSAELVAALAINDVDLVVLNDLPPGLAARIVLDGERLVRVRPELDHAFVRDVLLRWGDLRLFLRRTAAIKLEALAP